MSRILSADEPFGVKMFYGAVIGLCALLTVAAVADLGTRPLPSGGHPTITTLADTATAGPGFGAAS